MSTVEDTIREKAKQDFGTEDIIILKPKRKYHLPHHRDREYSEYSIIIETGEHRGMYDIVVNDKNELYSDFGPAGFT
uniref:Uncharacterized protein n=1 Tax=Pithovirus LCPAC304 TaxID=2506594 RepID=A0A481Z9D5_9VIRU|nr:MAG: hypothetical protein LCPAC304_04520 [Pithovirus LCPAC304]